MGLKGLWGIWGIWEYGGYGCADAFRATLKETARGNCTHEAEVLPSPPATEETSAHPPSAFDKRDKNILCLMGIGLDWIDWIGWIGLDWIEWIGLAN